MDTDEIIVEILEAFDIIKQFSCNNLLFLGDFNCRIDKKDNVKAKILLDQAEILGLKLANDNTTKTYGNDNNGSVIDLIFYSKNFKLKNFEVNQTTFIKKHHPVICKFKLKSETQIISGNKRSNLKPVYKIDFERLNFLVENNYVNLNSLLESDNIEDFYLHIVQIIQQSRQTPRKIRRKSKPWFDSECFNLRKTLLKIYHSLIMGNFRNQSKIEHFKDLRKEYKCLIHNKKEQFRLKKEQELILAAEEQAYLFLKQPIDEICKIQNPIPINEWVNHMSSFLNSKNLDFDEKLNLHTLLDNYDDSIVCEPISEAEIEYAVMGLRNKKSPGPDLLTNENIKSLLPLMMPLFLKFFNKCLSLGGIPKQWKESSMKILYKNKGKVDDVNSYRGICLSNTLCKLLDKIMARRLIEKFEQFIPEEQFGFMRGKSTIDAIKQFQIKISQGKGAKGYKKFALFIDLKRAFDLSNRKTFLEKLIEKKQLSKQELLLLAQFLESDKIQIDDGVSVSDFFIQSNGFKQGMNSSPICFNIYIYDIIKIFADNQGVEFLLFADDMVFISDCCRKLEKILANLVEYCKENNLEINFNKTKILKFTNGGKGKRADSDFVRHEGNDIEFVTNFCYLGVTFQKSGDSFSNHIKIRCKKSLTAMHFYGNLRNLSLDCAKKLFNLKFSPMATYGIEAIWENLKKCDLINLENLMLRYYKKVLGLSKYARNTYVYLLVEEDLFINTIKSRFELPTTKAYEDFLEDIEVRKDTDFNQDFLLTPAMTGNNWKKPLFKNRHVFTRFAIHGFHHLICSDKTFHTAREGCCCTLCGEKEISQYHIRICQKNELTLNQYAKMSNKI